MRLRRDVAAAGDRTMTWLDAPVDVLAFEREPGFVCVVNFGEEAVSLPALGVHGDVLLISAEAEEPVSDQDRDQGRNQGKESPRGASRDTTVWLRRTAVES